MLYQNDYLILQVAKQRMADLQHEAQVERLYKELRRGQQSRLASSVYKLLNYLGNLLVTVGERLERHQVAPVTLLK